MDKRFDHSQTIDDSGSDDAPSEVDFTYGFFEFTISGLGPGESTSLILHLPADAEPTTYYKYGKTPENPTDHWYEFLYDLETGSEIDGNIITIHFVDGKRGDDVLSQDSLVIDIGGPGFPSSDSSTTSGGSGGGCFINSLGH